MTVCWGQSGFKCEIQNVFRCAIQNWNLKFCMKTFCLPFQSGAQKKVAYVGKSKNEHQERI